MSRVGAPEGAVGATPDGVLHGSFAATGHTFVSGWCAESRNLGLLTTLAVNSIRGSAFKLFDMLLALLIFCIAVWHCICFPNLTALSVYVLEFTCQLFAWTESKQGVYVPVCTLCDFYTYVLVLFWHRSIEAYSFCYCCNLTCKLHEQLPIPSFI